MKSAQRRQPSFKSRCARRLTTDCPVHFTSDDPNGELFVQCVASRIEARRGDHRHFNHVVINVVRQTAGGRHRWERPSVTARTIRTNRVNDPTPRVIPRPGSLYRDRGWCFITRPLITRKIYCSKIRRARMFSWNEHPPGMSHGWIVESRTVA